jgi:hypothetical protein
MLCLLLQSALKPLVGFRPAQLSLSILSRKVLQSAVASGTSNPQHGGEPGIFRAFHLSPQEAPRVWSDASEPSSGRWNYGREVAENFAESGDFHVTFGFFTCRKAQHGTSRPKESVLRISSPEKSEGFGRVWTREVGYQRPARYLYTTEADYSNISAFIFRR